MAKRIQPNTTGVWLEDDRNAWWIDTAGGSLQEGVLSSGSQKIFLPDPLYGDEAKLKQQAAAPRGKFCRRNYAPIAIALGYEQKAVYALYRWEKSALRVQFSLPPTRHPHKAGWIVATKCNIAFEQVSVEMHRHAITGQVTIGRNSKIDKLTMQAAALVEKAKNLTATSDFGCS